MAEEKQVSRRGLLVGLGGLAAVAWGWQRFGVPLQSFDFAPIKGLPDWRMLETGSITAAGGSATSAVFVGIGTDDAPKILPPEQLCSTLFNTSDPDKVPVAMFTDFFCPYCRTMLGGLVARTNDPKSQISLTWHELPLLGPSSEIVARAALAAELQGGYLNFQSQLLVSGFRPTFKFLLQTAVAAGLDPGRFIFDMDGPEVAARLGASRSAAETLGIWGTPGLVVGRTLVMGAIKDDALSRLIELEVGVTGVC